MKLHKYSDDPLVKLLTDLSDKATPGPWRAEPKRVVVPTTRGDAYGPLMSYLAGSGATATFQTVSLGSERIADHEFVAALVNAWRDGRLTVILEG